MKNYKIDVISMFVITILLLNCNFIYILKNINKDIVLIFVVIFILYSFIITFKNKNTIDYKTIFKSKLGKLILCVIPIVFISAYTASKHYGQDIILGIRPQRQQLIWWLSYFAFYRLMKYDKLSYEKGEKIIFGLGICQIIVYFIFWLTNGKLWGFNIPYDYRYGNIRIRADTMTILIMYLMALNNILKNRKQKFNIVILLSVYIFECLCVKTRLIFLSMTLILIILFILWKKRLIVKILFIPIIAICIYTSMKSTIGKDIIKNLNGSTDSSYSIRDEAKEFYVGELKKNLLFGCGYINELDDNAVKLGKVNQGFYVNDNGFVGFLWYYGVTGGLWIIIIAFKILIISFKLYKYKKEYIGICFILFNIIIAPNIICWWWNTTFIFLMWIIIAYIELEVDKIENYKDNRSF